jgi:hypothetical protein
MARAKLRGAPRPDKPMRRGNGQFASCLVFRLKDSDGVRKAEGRRAVQPFRSA